MSHPVKRRRWQRDLASLLGLVLILTIVVACAPSIERDRRIDTTAAVLDLERLPALGGHPDALVPGPTGGSLLYTVRSSGNRVVTYIFGLESRERRLVHDGPIAGADWTPDGSGIVYSHWSPGSSASLADRISYYDVDTGTRRNITPSRDVLYGVPSVSPDGGRVAVTTASGDAGAAFVAALLGQTPEEVTFSTAIFSIGGGAFLQVIPDLVIGSPNAYHPHDEKLVGGMRFSTARNRIVEVDLATERTRALTSGLWALRNPGYSPNGTHVTYSARYDDLSHIYALDTSSGDLIAFTKGNTQNLNPAWGSDGYVYFLSDVASSGAVELQAWRLSTPLR